MDKPIFVIGAGGHAKVLIATLHELSIPIQGVVEKDPQLIGQEILGESIDSEEILKQYAPQEILLVNGVGSIDINSLRAKIFSDYKLKGYQFLSIIHPSAYLAEDVSYEEGCQIMAGCVIQPGCHFAANTVVNTRVSVDHDCIIGSDVHLAPGVVLSGGVSIEDNVHIGTGAIVIQNICLKRNSFVAAGAVVTKNTESNYKYMGIPARAFRL